MSVAGLGGENSPQRYLSPKLYHFVFSSQVALLVSCAVLFPVTLSHCLYTSELFCSHPRGFPSLPQNTVPTSA